MVCCGNLVFGLGCLLDFVENGFAYIYSILFSRLHLPVKLERRARRLKWGRIAVYFVLN
jgi:hypothetical protein